MGGLQDATNVIPAPLVCVLDLHQHGSHGARWEIPLEAIAAYRRPGSSSRAAGVVSLRQPPEAMRGDPDEACRGSGRMQPADRGSGEGSPASEQQPEGAAFFLRRPGRGCPDPLRGDLADRQRRAGPGGALGRFRRRAFPFRRKSCARGFRRPPGPAGFQVFPGKPLFVADGAHNEDASERG